MAEIIFRHGFRYPDLTDASLSDIAATLIAHEKITPIVGDLLEKLIDGLEVQKADIRLKNVVKGSLEEYFYVALFVVYQKKMDAAVDATVKSLTGVDLSDSADTLITILILIILYTGTKYLFDRKSGDPAKTPVEIRDSFNTYIGDAAVALGVRPQDVEAAANEVVTKARIPSAIKAAIDIFRPAKRSGNGRILPEGVAPIDPLAVAAFPSAAALADMEDDMVPTHFDSAVLHIRATDRDKADKGWAGILVADNLKTKRLPVKLYPTVDRIALAHLDSAAVEALLESRVLEDGDMRPAKIHILRVLD